MNDKSELLKQLQIDRTEQPRPTGYSLWQLIVVVVIAVAASAWLSRTFLTPQAVATGPENRVQQLEPKPLDTSNPATPTPAPKVAAKSDLANEAILNSSGYITARRMATVSAEIMGLITEVNVEEGMVVEQGQVLAKLDDALASVSLDMANAQIDVLKARRSALEANLQEARRNLKRVQENSFSSDAERTSSAANVQSLEAQLESADADIRVARIEVRRQSERLADHTIRAPFGGVVTVKNAQPGEIVAPTSAGGGFTRTGICTIVDMQSLEIEVDVNESFIGRVFPGQPVEARLDAYPDWVIPASVIAIIPTADRAKATVQVRIKIELEDTRILPDMGVKVAFLKS